MQSIKTTTLTALCGLIEIIGRMSITKTNSILLSIAIECVNMHAFDKLVSDDRVGRMTNDARMCDAIGRSITAHNNALFDTLWYRMYLPGPLNDHIHTIIESGVIPDIIAAMDSNLCLVVKRVKKIRLDEKKIGLIHVADDDYVMTAPESDVKNAFDQDMPILAGKFIRCEPYKKPLFHAINLAHVDVVLELIPMRAESPIMMKCGLAETKYTW